MRKLNLKRGYDIKIAGDIPAAHLTETIRPESVALRPIDFFGLKEKLLVEEGDKVKVGTPLFYAKSNNKIKFCSPVSGEVTEIVRGERRKVLRVVVKSDNEYETEAVEIPTELDRDKILDILLKTGLFPVFTQRPYGIIPDPEKTPRDIFISTFNTEPMVLNPSQAMESELKYFKKGIEIASKLTDGKTYVAVNDKTEKLFSDIDGVEYIKVSGAHPAGNVGVHIHHTAPIKSVSDIVWTGNIFGLMVIGRLFTEGKLSYETYVKLTGSNARSKGLFKTIMGASFKSIDGQGSQGYTEIDRIITGSVLTGAKIEENDFLGYHDNTFTVIPEPHKHEFMGWMMPGFDKASTSKTFPSGFSEKEFDIPAQIYGGKRAFIFSGIYDDVTPMDIYPVYLAKSIIAEDIDEMIALGILEMIPEDVALCEYICPSKIEWQELFAKGIALTIKEA